MGYLQVKYYVSIHHSCWDFGSAENLSQNVYGRMVGCFGCLAMASWCYLGLQISDQKATFSSQELWATSFSFFLHCDLSLCKALLKSSQPAVWEFWWQGLLRFFFHHAVAKIHQNPLMRRRGVLIKIWLILFSKESKQFNS